MAKFKNETLKTSFSLPDPFTIGDHSAYEVRKMETIANGGRTRLVTSYMGALAIIQDWESKILPDPLGNLLELGKLSGDKSRIVIWVGAAVLDFVTDWLTIPDF